MVVIQKNRTSSRNRYPEIFTVVSELMPDASKVLSFGCGPGEELITLTKYFKKAVIYGYDIEPIDRRVHGKRIAIVKNLEDLEGEMDIVFAMSVLCRWPDLLRQDNITDIFPYSIFDDAIADIDRHVRPGGLMVLYNTNYAFDNFKQSHNYVPLQFAHIPQQYVPIYSPRGPRLSWKPSAYIFLKK